MSSFPLDEIALQVNHPEVTSVYPPLAMWLFALCSSLLYSPMSMKIVASVADVFIVFGLYRIAIQRKQSTENAWLYALHDSVGLHRNMQSNTTQPAYLAATIWAW